MVESRNRDEFEPGLGLGTGITPGGKGGSRPCSERKKKRGWCAKRSGSEGTGPVSEAKGTWEREEVSGPKKIGLAAYGEALGGG